MLLLVTPEVWVSPGEWGSAAFTGFLLGCLGTIVSTRAARADITFTFLGCHALLLFGRALWLGDPLAIPLYRLEYAWDMNWCDPCAADPLSRDELRGLGVFWLDDAGPATDGSRRPGGIRRPGPIPPRAQDVFVTRLHLRYDNAHFPDDLVFQHTGNRENFQGRYVVQHEWTGGDSCEAATRYRADLPQRREQLAEALSSMTGWPLADVRKKMTLGAVQAPTDASWWERLWPRQ